MTERIFSTFQIASLLRAAPGAVVQWMDKGWLNSSKSSRGIVQITESDLVKFLEDQGFEFGDELTRSLTPEQRDQVYERARARKAAANYASNQAKTEKAIPIPVPEPEPEPISEPIPEPVLISEPEPEPEPEPLAEPPQSPPVNVEPAKLQSNQICDAILSDAVKHGASEIHLTPYRDELKLQLRINGSLSDKPHFDNRLPDGLKREIIADLLNRANPEIVPEDLTTAHSFEFTESVEGSLLALRLSVLPTVNGPRLVIRIPQQPGGPANLVLEPTARGRLEELLQGDGLIVLASKRRTGRDQTLRALLASTDTCGRSIITIEQNSQPSLDDVVQLQIDRSSGLTCAAAMEAMEDQDADTIILAELRDPATALAAFDAAHDGALVVAGVNASSVDGVIDELLAMGIEPWPLGRTLKAIIVQATVRTLCEHCDGGCDRCSQSGWSGRTVLSGVVFVEGKLSELIRSGGTPEQFAQAIAQSDIGSLAHTARQAVDAGITTPDEIARILHRKFRCD